MIKSFWDLRLCRSISGSQRWKNVVPSSARVKQSQFFFGCWTFEDAGIRSGVQKFPAWPTF